MHNFTLMKFTRGGNLCWHVGFGSCRDMSIRLYRSTLTWPPLIKHSNPSILIRVVSKIDGPKIYCVGSHPDFNRYKYKFLRATTSNIPSSVIKENRGSKVTVGRGGMLKVQHLVSVARTSIPHSHIDSAGYQQPSRIAYIEFFVKPEEDEDTVND